MKRLLIWNCLCVMILLSSCTRGGEIEVLLSAITLEARTESADGSRTIVENGVNVYWEPGDEIVVFCGDRIGKFESQISAPSATATFTGIMNSGTLPSGEEIWALYPYQQDAVFDGETITATFPSLQTARAGSFGKNMNLSIARSSNTSLRFYNVGGGIRFSVTEEGVKAVVLESIGKEPLAGRVRIGFSEALPRIEEITEGTSVVTIMPPGDGVFETGVWYYITTIPGTLSEGFQLRFYTDDSSAGLRRENAATVKRSIYGSLSAADAGITFVPFDNEAAVINDIGEIVSGCVTEALNADVMLEAKRAELEALPYVSRVDIGDASTDIHLVTGETLIYPYDYPSIFDSEEDQESSAVSGVKSTSASLTRSSGYSRSQVVIFNFFSGERKRKQQNKLMERVGKIFENAGYSVCYCGKDDFTTENVEDAVKNNSIIFFSTHGNSKGDYICLGEEKGDPRNPKEALENAQKNCRACFAGSVYGEPFKKYWAEDVKALLKDYSGPMVYFASCNTMKTDFDQSKNIIGWNGVNVIGQAYALIIADYFAGDKVLGDKQKSFMGFYTDFSSDGSLTGSIIDPQNPKTKLKYTGKGWRFTGNDYTGWKSYRLNHRLAFDTPYIGQETQSTKKFTVKATYKTKYGENFQMDGKNDTFDNGNKYWFHFSNMDDEKGSSEYLRFKEGKVEYTWKKFSPGVWKIKSYSGDKNNDFWWVHDCTYLIMSKDFKENAGEVVDAMPAPDVVTLKASVESKGVFLAGGVNNRPLDGLSTGFRYWKKGQPFTAKEIAASVEYKEVFAVMLEEALSGGEYEVLAFATDEDGRTVEGDTLSFVSGNAPQPDHEAVDLGLPSGLKWATCNVGATQPEEYGDYFAWGETEPYYEAGYAQSFNPVWKAGKSDGYSWNSYQWCNGSYNTLTKYNIESKYGPTVDYQTILKPEDDAAWANWGDRWRMPTMEDWNEIKSHCTWIEAERNGINGLLITGPNGNSIFLPVGGRRGETVFEIGSYGQYWTSSLSTLLPSHGVHISFYSGLIESRSFMSRARGLLVRPVYEYAPRATISVWPSNLDFGKVTVGSYLSKTAMVTNTGTAPLTFRLEGGSDDYSFAPAGDVTVTSGGMATVTVTFTPRNVTHSSCAISIISNASNGTQFIDCSGEGVSFPVPEHEAVDLGLPSGLKWATCNVGASSPEDYGDYFAWGETNSKSDYNWENYIFRTKGYNGYTVKFSKYTTLDSYASSGVKDIKETIEPADDAARVNWGGSWRMPTRAEFEELINNCTEEWINMNGVDGKKLISKINGNSIFLPTMFTSDTFQHIGTYWSSSLHSDIPYEAWCLFMTTLNFCTVRSDRYKGSAVRPVIE